MAQTARNYKFDVSRIQSMHIKIRTLINGYVRSMKDCYTKIPDIVNKFIILYYPQLFKWDHRVTNKNIQIDDMTITAKFNVGRTYLPKQTNGVQSNVTFR